MTALPTLKTLTHDKALYDRPTVHIAGSKGKGTTAFLLAELLKRHGKKTGLFVSPHLLEPREMVLVDGQMMDSSNWDLLNKEIAQWDADLSEFERWTLVALTWFQRQACDFVVLECGWGGARDATNAVEKKLLTILTHIEGEHLGVLGDTLAEIAVEKLGITRPDVPLLTVIQRPDVQEVIDELDVPVTLAPLMDCGLHHPESAGLAVEAFEKLGFTLAPDDMNALADLEIPGRMEIVNFGVHTLILDGAHTADSIDYIRRTAQEWSIHHEKSEPFYAIHILKDKPDALLGMFPLLRTVWIPIEDVRARTKPYGFTELELDELLARLKTQTEPELWLFVGSFKLVAAVKQALSNA